MRTTFNNAQTAKTADVDIPMIFIVEELKLTECDSTPTAFLDTESAICSCSGLKLSLNCKKQSSITY